MAVDFKTPLYYICFSDQSCQVINLHFPIFANPDNISIGSGNIMVEFLSPAIELRVCRYLSCKAPGESPMMSAASLRAREAFCSPSAAMTCER